MPSTDHKYQVLLAVSEAIVSHRELSALFHELAGRLHQLVRFDYLALYLHEATRNTMHPHVLEGTEPVPLPSAPVLPLEEDPAGWVWQTQQARIFSNVPEEKRWPRPSNERSGMGFRVPAICRSLQPGVGWAPWSSRASSRP